MDAYLLCDEVWLSSPVTHLDHPRPHNHAGYGSPSNTFHCSFYTTEEDYKQAFSISIEKEMNYVPEPDYIEFLHKENLVVSRFRCIQWLIKSRSRFNLSFETVFHAANYLDRFISMNKYKSWSYWMVELLAVACLSVASKFNETHAPTLHEILMEDLENKFQSITVQQMELKLLQALKWRLASLTSYSYVELLTWKLEKPLLHERIVAQMTVLLLESLLDVRVTGYKPSVVAVSTLLCSLDELVMISSDAYMSYIRGLLNQDQKDEMVKCHAVMKNLHTLRGCGCYYYSPPSPTTVLLKARIDYNHDLHVNQSMFGTCSPASNAEAIPEKRKRKRRE